MQKKYDDAWKYGTKPIIKRIYKIIEGKSFLLPYDKYKLVPLPYYYDPNLTIPFPGKRLVETQKCSDTTALRDAANLGRMETACFATIVVVRYVAFSRHLSRQPLLIRTERKFLSPFSAVIMSLIVNSFGAGIYTSSAANKYVSFRQYRLTERPEAFFYIGLIAIRAVDKAL